MSVTKKVVKKIRARNPLSEDDSDVSYDKGDYDSDDDKKREPEEERVPADTLGSLGLPSFPECIVSREDWGAAKKKRKGLALKHPVANVTITYKTDVPKCTSDEECVKVIQELQKKHISEGMSDIAFNFLIGADYRVYEGRGWEIQPEPKYQYPELRGKRLDIAFLGDYSGNENQDIAMAGLAIDLAHYGVTQEFLLKRYRLIESDCCLGSCDYEPGKKEEHPEYAFRIEDWYPENPKIEEKPKSLFEEIGDRENVWDDY